ncbi:hypothetical protein CPB83DRAFT_856494 [Crepidotus variabilis]|uniref:Phospholipid/glycerol acyltransferase domain-containing protein n=1 Tax=Crepidotus variabilis TaxID=179855 RepID=A0A9P6EDR6_9AGAR|nr:hypothetical protein CPB83DRAFT_856494 [Crepidotus variabilis]
MEAKLVYRTLRKISDWTVNGYYSEVYVEGQQNISKSGPLVVAPTHHNEILDIATLSITIPYGRHVSFWAKASMFKNPILGAILSSSGAIPVKRNPNASESTRLKNTAGSEHVSYSETTQKKRTDEGKSVLKPDDRASLFYNTSEALARGEVIGVFPEGTSYTQPEIAQVMPGAGWVGVEYLKFITRSEGTVNEKGKPRTGDNSLKIVPVAIVYTDKTRYRSRVYVRFGKPIEVDKCVSHSFHEAQDQSEDHSKALVMHITHQVEKSLRKMTINAPDWDTVCAVAAARNILWGDEDYIRLRDWVEVSQSLVELLAPKHDSEQSDVKENSQLKEALTKYYALLHYTGIKHSTLCSLVPMHISHVLDASTPPQPFFTVSSSQRPVLLATFSLLVSLPPSLVRLALFLPPLLLHLPGYITGHFAGKMANPGEYEAVAQLKSVGGGVGIGLGVLGGLGWVGWSKSAEILAWLAQQLLHLGSWSGVFGPSEPLQRLILDKAKSPCTVLGTIYLGMWLLVKWHGVYVDANYQQSVFYARVFYLFTAHLSLDSNEY